METAFQSGSFAHSLDSETSLSRSSSYSVLEGSPYTIPPHVQSSHLGSDAGSSSSALQALYEGGSRGVFQWVEATAQVSQAVKMCLEQLVGPNTPGHVKRSAADVLACVCLGRHQQCSLALMSSDINGLMCQALKIASCSDAHIVRRSTQLCVLLLLCSLHQEHESREVVFGRAEHVATVLHLCLRLVASRHLTTAGEAAVCLLAPLLPLLASQAQAEAAARAVVDLLKHCVEVGCEGEGLGTWLLSEHSSSATEEGHAQGEQEVHMAPPLALRPPLFSDGIGFGCGSVASGSSTGEGSGSSISDAVAVVACKVLHALLHTDAHSSSAAGVVVEERGLAPLVALLEGRGALTTAVQAPAVTVPEAAAAAAAAASTSTQPAHSTADAILGGGTVSRVATELGVWATDCLFDVMEVCAAEGAAAQVVAAGGVKALLQLLQLPHADSPLSHKALRMLCQLLGAAEGQQSLMNQGGLPVLAGFAQTQPELVLGTLTAFCTSSAAVTRAAVAQCQPALCALVHAIGCPSAPVSQQAIAALQAVLDSAINTASDVGPEAAAGAEEAGADQAAEDGADAKQQQQGIPSEDSEEDATPEQAETAAAAAAAAVIYPVALRLVEAGAMQQLDGLLGTLVDGGDAGTAEEHDHLRAAFSLCTKLVVASPDACHALLHLQQEQQQQQQQQQQQALCGTFRASAVLLRAHTTPSDKLVASVLLLRLLQHCRASCAAPCACDLQHQQEQRQEQEQPVQHGREEEGAGAPSWVGWAAGCLASTLPTGDCSSPLAEQQQQQQQQQQFTALLGTAEALEMIPVVSVGIVFAEDARCLRQLTYLSTLLMPPPPSHPFFYAAAAGMPHTLLSHAFALAQHSAQSSSSSSSRRTWGCQLLQLTAPGLAAALTAEAPHPQRHTLLLRLGLQAVDCAMALCSSSSSSGGGGECEDSGTTSCSSAAPPHSAVLAVCNGLLACVNSAAVQGQMEQQQAQAVLRVCAYLQQQLLVRPEAWHVLLGIDAHAAGELTGATQQCLRAVIAALSQEQQCAHFKALAAAALTMADFATKQAQALPSEPQAAKRKAAEKADTKRQKGAKKAAKGGSVPGPHVVEAVEKKEDKEAEEEEEEEEENKGNRGGGGPQVQRGHERQQAVQKTEGWGDLAGMWPSLVRPGLGAVAQIAEQVGLAVHKEAAKRLKGPKAVQRKRTHKPDKQEKKGRPAAGNDSQEDLSVNKVEGKKSRSAAGEDNEEQLMEKGHLSKQEDEVDNRREDAQECLAAGEAAGEKAGGDGSEQPSLLQQQQQQQQRQKEGGLHARGDGAGTSGGRKEVGEVAVQLAMAMAMATDEGLMAHGGEVVAAGGPVKQEQEQAEVVATRDPVTQGQAEVMVTEGLVGQEQAEIQESTGAEGQADGVPGEAGVCTEGGECQGGVLGGGGVEEGAINCSSCIEAVPASVEGAEQGGLLSRAPCAETLPQAVGEGVGQACQGGESGAEQGGGKKKKKGETGEAAKKGKEKKKGTGKKEKDKEKEAKAEVQAETETAMRAKDQAAGTTGEAACASQHGLKHQEASVQELGQQETPVQELGQQEAPVSDLIHKGDGCRLQPDLEQQQPQQQQQQQQQQEQQEQQLMQGRLAEEEARFETAEQQQPQPQPQQQPLQEDQRTEGSGKAKKDKEGQQQQKQHKKRAEGTGKAKKEHKQKAQEEAKAQASTAPGPAARQQDASGGSLQAAEQDQKQQQQQQQQRRREQLKQRKRKQQQQQWDKLPVWGKVVLGVANAASGSAPKVAQAWRYCRESFL